MKDDEQVIGTYCIWTAMVEQNWSTYDFDTVVPVPNLWYMKQKNKIKI
jgi:hypothetical protein